MMRYSSSAALRSSLVAYQLLQAAFQTDDVKALEQTLIAEAEQAVGHTEDTTADAKT